LPTLSDVPGTTECVPDVMIVTASVTVTGEDAETGGVVTDELTGAPRVQITFTPDGARRFQGFCAVRVAEDRCCRGIVLV